MSKPTKVIVDLSKPKGEREQIVELTDEEIAELEARRVEAEEEFAAEQAAAEAKAAAKQAAQEKLAALGLTPEEIAAITQ